MGAGVVVRAREESRNINSVDGSSMRHIYLRAVLDRHSAKLITIEYRYPADALMLISGYYEALARPDGLGRFAGITSPYFGGPGIRTPALERSLNSDKMILFECTLS